MSDDEVEVVVKLNQARVDALRSGRALGDRWPGRLILAALEEQHPEPHQWRIGDWFDGSSYASICDGAPEHYEGWYYQIVSIQQGHVVFVEHIRSRSGGPSFSQALDTYLSLLQTNASPCSPPQWFIDQEQADG